jgi:hypothetical protein
MEFFHHKLPAGVDDDLGEIVRLHGLGAGGNRQALLQQRLEPRPQEPNLSSFVG